VAAQWLPLCPLVGLTQWLECLCHFLQCFEKEENQTGQQEHAS
jgi:hypothetical protein